MHVRLKAMLAAVVAALALSATAQAASAKRRLPWHLRYDSLAGTPPRIAGICCQMVGDAELLTGLGGQLPI
jgi:hypothetical protein